MRSITLKDVPSRTHQALKARAKDNNRSLNREVIGILNAAVRIEEGTAVSGNARRPAVVREPAVAYEVRPGARAVKDDLLRRISVDPRICFGRPCVRGTRIWVALLLDLLAGGMTAAEILQEYPELTQEDILAALAYGAAVSRDRFVDLPA